MRSFPGQTLWAANAPAVGCGYAAFSAVHAQNAVSRVHLFIVKLADGSAWDLAPLADSNARFNWGPPAAITCDEVFAPMADNLRRIRLDSLGPPQAAD